MADAYGNNVDAMVSETTATASNVISGTNPAYGLTDFYAVYPVYGPRGVAPNITYLVDPTIIQMYIDLADASIKEARWHTAWHIAMGWFVAHFATLYLQGTASPTGTAAQVIAASQSHFLMSSKSVGDVSVAYDTGTTSQDLDGWAAWKLTIYGQQLATMGKLIGRGGMYVR